MSHEESTQMLDTGMFIEEKPDQCAEMKQKPCGMSGMVESRREQTSLDEFTRLWTTSLYIGGIPGVGFQVSKSPTMGSNTSPILIYKAPKALALPRSSRLLKAVLGASGA